MIPHFTLNEVRCLCGCGLMILQPELLTKLEALRIAYGHPILVNSWTRCKSHNEAVGGVANSYHLNGKAVDLMPPYRPALDMLEVEAKVVFPFVKRYKRFIHCDIRGERPI